MLISQCDFDIVMDVSSGGPVVWSAYNNDNESEHENISIAMN